MPLPRMPIYLRRFAEHVCSYAARRLRLHQGNGQAIQTQRSGARRDAGILRRMRHAYRDAAAGFARRGFEGRDAGRTEPVWRAGDGDLYDRQATLPSYPRGHAELRARAGSMRRARSGAASALSDEASIGRMAGIKARLSYKRNRRRSETLGASVNPDNPQHWAALFPRGRPFYEERIRGARR